MPARTRSDAAEPAAPTTALVPPPAAGGLLSSMPDDIRRDLLQAQQQGLGERVRLPQAKIMAAGAGLFEFTDTHETTREFVGVILGSHARNVLWDKAYGTSNPATDESPVPACSSNDGKYGVPRQGFAHAALRGPAVGTERIACRTCPYNQWGSKNLIPAIMRPGDSGKGKAVVNQRAVYLLLSGRAAPVELVLPPTSIQALDEYMATLLNHNTPVQAILTHVKQEVQSRGTMRWGQATFTAGEQLSNEAFSRVIAVRGQWISTINGVVEEIIDTPEPVDTPPNAPEATGGEDDGEMPSW